VFTTTPKAETANVTPALLMRSLSSTVAGRIRRPGVCNKDAFTWLGLSLLHATCPTVDGIFPSIKTVEQSPLSWLQHPPSHQTSTVVHLKRMTTGSVWQWVHVNASDGFVKSHRARIVLLKNIQGTSTFCVYSKIRDLRLAAIVVSGIAFADIADAAFTVNSP
jgi:hypothetical protein